MLLVEASEPGPHQRRPKHRLSRAQAGFSNLRGSWLQNQKPIPAACNKLGRGRGVCLGFWFCSCCYCHLGLRRAHRRDGKLQTEADRGSPRAISQRQPQPGQALLLSHAGLRFWAMVMDTTDGSVRAWATPQAPNSQRWEMGTSAFLRP